MAYTLPLLQKQLQDLQENQPVSLGAAGQPGQQPGTDNISTGSGQQLALQGRGGLGNQYVNFGDLVEANKLGVENAGQQIGKIIGIEGAENEITKAATDFASKSNQGITELSDDVINKIVDNPFASTEGYDTVSSVLQGKGYKGPTSAGEVYGNAKTAVNKAMEKASLLNDPSGLKSVMMQSPDQGFTQGMANLDSALIYSNPAVKDQFKNVQDRATALGGKLTTSQAGTDALIKQNLAKQQSIADRARSRIGGAASSLEQANLNELNALRAQDETARASFAEAAKRGDVGAYGFDKGNADFSGKDLSGFVKWNPASYSTGNVLDANEIAKLTGYYGLLGSGGDFIKQAGSGGSGSFDFNAALAALQKGQGQGTSTGGTTTPAPGTPGESTAPGDNTFNNIKPGTGVSEQPGGEEAVNKPVGGTVGGGFVGGAGSIGGGLGGGLGDFGGTEDTGGSAGIADTGLPDGVYIGRDGYFYDSNGVWQGPEGSVGIDPSTGKLTEMLSFLGGLAVGGLPGYLLRKAGESYADYERRVATEYAFEKNRQEVAAREDDKDYGQINQDNINAVEQSIYDDVWNQGITPSEPPSNQELQDILDEWAKGTTPSEQPTVDLGNWDDSVTSDLGDSFEGVQIGDGDSFGIDPGTNWGGGGARDFYGGGDNFNFAPDLGTGSDFNLSADWMGDWGSTGSGGGTFGGGTFGGGSDSSIKDDNFDEKEFKDGGLVKGYKCGGKVMAEGGLAAKNDARINFTAGGKVDGPGGPRDDLIPAKLSAGEYVIPAHIVEALGADVFDSLLKKFSK